MGSSAQDHLLSTYGEVNDLVSYGMVKLGVFIDNSKTFDFKHEVLLSKIRCFGISGRLLN